MNSTDDDTKTCSCCGQSGNNKSFAWDYRLLKSGNIMKLLVCNNCIDLDDSMFWKMRCAVYRLNNPYKNQLPTGQRPRFRSRYRRPARRRTYLFHY